MGNLKGIEDHFREICAEILCLSADVLDLNRSFLAQGGDSLRAVQLMGRLFDIDIMITLDDIAFSNTLSDLLQHCTELKKSSTVDASTASFSSCSFKSGTTDENDSVIGLASNSSDSSVPGLFLLSSFQKQKLLGYDIEHVTPCSPMQEAILTSQQVKPENYACRCTLKLNSADGISSINVRRVQSAWEYVVARHDVLRTLCLEDENSEGRFLQVVVTQGRSTSIVEGVEDVVDWFESKKSKVLAMAEISSHLTIVSTATGDVYCQLEITHALVDGLSLSVLMQDFISSYVREAPLRQGPQFHDYIELLSDTTQIEMESSKYWDHLLHDIDPCLFPALRGEEDERKLMTSTLAVDLLSSNLSAFCESHEVTLSSICQAAWAIVLASFCYEEQVCFAYASSGRDVAIKGINNAAGLFIHTLPSPVNVRSTRTPIELIQEVQRSTLTSIKHQRSVTEPLRRKTLEVGGHLFNTMMSFIRYPFTGRVEAANTYFEVTEIHNPTEYDLWLRIETGDNKAMINLDYWTTHISPENADNIITTFQQVLFSLTNNHKSQLSELNLLSPQGLQTVQTWNVEVPPTTDRCIHNVIHEQTMVTPTAPAICSWDGNFTYEELWSLSSALATHLLKHHGVQPEMAVPICFDKSAWAIVSMLAILQSGAVCVPLNPKDPSNRLRTILADVKAKIVLVSTSYRHVFQDLELDTLDTNEEFVRGLSGDECNLLDLVKPSNAAYIIYTSGSTGSPKGVVLEHSALCTSAQAHGTAFAINSESRVAQFAAYTFDVSIQDIFTTLQRGGCVCVLSEDERLNDLAGAIRRRNANWIDLTSTVVSILCPEDFPSIRTLILAGEAVDPSIIEPWAQMGKRLINSYGPAECSINATCSPDLVKSSQSADIGTPLSCLFWVANPNNHNALSPLGAIGELLLEGPILSRGYLNDQAKTDRSFVCPAYMAALGFHSRKRLYKTGDLVRLNLDGSLLYIGRKDAQIKVRGQRVEVEEIESHLRRNDNHIHAAVVMPKKGPCNRQLVAVVETRDKKAMSTSSTLFQLAEDATRAIRSKLASARISLSRNVPPHMVPSLWIPVVNLPWTRSNKLDRYSILRWVEQMDEASYHGLLDVTVPLYPEPPRNAVELKVQEVVQDILGMKEDLQILERSFLSLGGDSIHAIKVVQRLRREGFQLSVRDLIESPSILQTASRTQTSRSSQIEIEGIMEDELFDLSPIQKLYFSQVHARPPTSTNLSHFNQCFCFRLSRTISKEQLQSTIELIVSRHAALRTRFVQVSTGDWRQYVSSNESSTSIFFYHQLSRDGAESIMAIANKRIDIANGPVFSADLLDTGEGRPILCLCAHHLVVDLVSWQIILQDIQHLLETGSLLESADLSFQQWCKIQRNKARKVVDPSFTLPYEVEPTRLDYWGMAETPNLYRDTYTLRCSFDHETTTLLFGRANNALRTDPIDILNATLLISFGQTLPDRSLPIIYNESHGRQTQKAELDPSNTVGWFTSIYPMIVSHSDFPNLANVLRKVKDRRKALPSGGQEYFNFRFLTDEGRQRFADHDHMEILLNFLGGSDLGFEKSSLLQLDTSLPTATECQFGANVHRMALIEINAAARNGSLEVYFTFNDRMNYQERLKEWVGTFEEVLIHVAKDLAIMDRQLTLADIPQMQMSYDSLENLVTNYLEPLLGGVNNIENMYQCSPMQEGILLSQTVDPATYIVSYHTMVRSNTAISKPISVSRLTAAWQAVVDYHPMLRTIFIQSSSQSSTFFQVVLSVVVADIAVIHLTDELEDFLQLDNQHPLANSQQKPHHRLSLLCTPSGKIWCQLDISHTLIDATSIAIITRDFAKAYSGHLQPGQSPSYGNYSAFLSSQTQGLHLKYWASYLSNARATHFPMTGGNTNSHGRVSTYSKFSITENIAKLCSAKKVTIAAVVQTAWALVLRAYTGSDQVCFGYLTDARSLPIKGIADMVGPLINMMVCNITLEALAPVIEVIARVQQDILDSFDHQFCSLADIESLADIGERHLFNSVMSFRHVLEVARDTTSDIVFDEAGGRDPTEYPVVVNVESTDHEIKLALHCSRQLISDAAAANIMSAFETAIYSLLSASDKSINQISLLSNDRRCQLETWNQPLPSIIDSCIHEIVEEQVRTLPHDQRAVTAWDGEFSYAELDSLASRLARYLVSLGLNLENQTLALCFEKSKWAVVAGLASLKAGFTVFFLPYNHPFERLKFMLERTKASLVLTSAETQPLFRKLTIKTMVVDSSLESMPESGGIMLPKVSPSKIAFIIFTSGSTGTPKGILLGHQALCTSAFAHNRSLGVTTSSRVFQFAAYAHDMSISDTFHTLMAGGCVCIPSEHERMNDIEGAMQRMNVNWAFLTPTVASLIEPRKVPSLRRLALGGEAVTTSNVNAWADRVHLNAIWGPAECSCYASASTRKRVGDDPNNIGTFISSPFFITEVTNPDQLMPIGGVGEILIAGPTVAQGYLQDSAKTAAAFLTQANWLTAGHSNRIYRTGDLGRLNPDGSLSFLGRNDGQIKIHGQRVELEEVSSHILRILNTAGEVVVVAVKTDKRLILCAYIVLLSQHEPTAEKTSSLALPGWGTVITELHGTLRDALPRYMVPTYFVPLNRLPTAATGKLDRRALEKLALNFNTEALALYTPSNHTNDKRQLKPLEFKLRELWAQELGVKAEIIRLTDDFFCIGGSSVSAMRLVAAAQQEGLKFTVADLFINSTLEEMAGVVKLSGVAKEIPAFSLYTKGAELSSGLAEIATMCQVGQDTIEDVYPCSPLQEAIMAASAKQPGSYLMRKVYHLSNELSVEQVKAAWNRTVAALPILRTRIVASASGTLQVVLKYSSSSWDDECAVFPRLSSEGEGNALYGQPLSRYSILQQPNGSHSFVWTIHHAIFDGWSFIKILELFRSFYTGGSGHEKGVPPTVPYNAFIKYLQDRDSSLDQGYWLDQLAGGSPTSFPRIPENSLKKSKTQTIRKWTSFEHNQKNGVTLSIILRAAWAFFSARYCDSWDTVFGATISGRNAAVEDMLGIIGPTIATVPIRIGMKGREKLIDYLERVDQQAREMIPFEHTGIHNLKRLLPQLRERMEISTLLLVQPVENQSGQGLEGFSDNSEDTTVDLAHPLLLECFLNSKKNSLEIAARFDTSVAHSVPIGRLLDQYIHVFRQMCVASPGMLLNELELVTPQDLQDICVWNDISLTRVESCIPHMFKTVSDKQPDAVAVTTREGAFTYAQLDTFSERLASHLALRGVKKGDMVPLLFEKSMWAVLSMLAVMRAGAACVPLDPKAPLSSTKLKLEILDPKVVLVGASVKDQWDSIDSRSFTVDTTLVNALKTDDSQLLGSKIRHDDPAFVVFTSGSTGVPKAIVLQHDSLCTSMKAHGARLGFNGTSRVLQYAAYTFDVSIQDIFTTLIHGGCVCIPAEEERVNISRLVETITELDVNWACLTSTVAQLISPKDVPTLKTLVLGGEPSSEAVIRKWSGAVTLHTVYGPAEASIWASCKNNFSTADSPMSIGTPMASKLWIVDPSDHNRLAPVGWIGELLIEGPLLAREYLHDRKRTTASFITSTAWGRSLKSGEPNRLYKTGDLVCYNLDGSLKFVGRKDSQVKINGQRVDLGEIEHHLEESLVLSKNFKVCIELVDTGGQRSRRRLVACIEAGEEAECSTLSEELKVRLQCLPELLSKKLPMHMVPSVFVPMKHFPMNSPGKLDRKAIRHYITTLPESELYRFAFSEAKAETRPRTRFETEIANLWASVLNLEASEVKLEDNFFRLGGDSVTAMILLAKAHSKQIEIDFANVFRHPTLAGLASTARELPVQQDNPLPFSLMGDWNSELLSLIAQQCDLHQEEIEDVYPCTPSQEGTMAASIRRPGTYVAQNVLRLDSSVDSNHFRLAWEVAERDLGILRTRIVLTDAKALQVVTSKRQRWCEGPSVELYLAEDRQIPFTYGSPLSRFAFVHQRQETGTVQKFFVWTVHHALYDEWTLHKIFQRVACYFKNQPTPETVPFNHFIRHLVQHDDEASKRYWKRELHDPPTRPPSVLSRPQHRKIKGGQQRIMFREIIFQAKVESEITLATYLRAAWALTLAQYSHSSDVIFATVISGREAPVVGISDVVGPTISVAPVRVQIDWSATVASFLHDIQNQAAAMIAHQHYGVSNISRLDHTLQQILGQVNHLFITRPSSQEADRVNLPGIDLLPQSVAGLTLYDLVFECRQRKSVTELCASYATSVISEAQMSKIFDQYIHILQKLIEAAANPAHSLDSIDLLNPGDITDLVKWKSAPTSSASPSAAIHQVFDSRVDIQPDAIAIKSENICWTYSEVQALSFRLSALLVDQLPDPSLEPKVLLCFDRSPWTIVAILAVLRIGGVCVPVDANHGLDSLLKVIRDVRPELILCGQEYQKIFKFNAESSPCLVIDSSIQEIKSGMPEPPDRRVDGSHAAFIVYEPARTGSMRGVALEHRAINASIRNLACACNLGPSTKMAHHSSYTSMASLLEVFATLHNGACLCEVGLGTENCDLSDVNTLICSPRAARLLLPAQLLSLETLILTKGYVDSKAISAWPSHMRTIQVLGSAECAASSPYIALAGATSPPGRTSPYAIPTDEAWVVHVSNPDKLSPVGATGRLLIGGPVLARELLNDEAGTREAFIQPPVVSSDPRSTVPIESRAFKSDYLARYTPTGELEIMGQLDRCVSHNGHEFNLGDVEAVLSLIIPDNHSVAVELIQVSQPHKQRHLAAFVLGLETEESGDSGIFAGYTAENLAIWAAWKSQLSQHIPDHMVPEIFVPVKKFPIDWSGLVDRSLLRKSFTQLPPDIATKYLSLSSNDSVAPASKTEQELQLLWANQLDISTSSVGINSKFTQLGGDSITAMRLVAKATHAGYSLSLSDVIGDSTLSQIATLIDSRRTAAVDTGTYQPFALLALKKPQEEALKRIAEQCEINVEQIEDVYPCTPLQEELIAGPDPSSYAVQKRFKLPKGLSLERLRLAWEMIHNKHPILRTRITIYGKQSLQVVVKESIGWGPPPDLNTRQQRVFGYGTQLSHLAILECEDGTNYFIWTLHHALYDGWSMAGILKQVYRFYATSLEPRAVPYHGFISYLKNQDQQRAADFWKAYLAGRPYTGLPIASPAGLHPREALPSRKHCQKLLLDQEAAGTPLSELLKAAWALTISVMTGQNDVVFGLVMLGRSAPVPGIVDMLLPTVAVVPWRTRLLHRLTSVHRLLELVHQDSVEMLRYEHTGLHNIRRLCPEQRDATNFNTLLTVHPTDLVADSIMMAESSLQTQLEERFGAFPLEVDCYVTDDEVEIQFTFDERFVTKNQVGGLASQFVHTLKELASSRNRNLPLCDLELVTPTALEDIKSQNSRPLHIETNTSCVQNEIAKLAIKTPDMIAVAQMNGPSLTYGLLDWHAEHLARRLQDLGVGPEVPVLLQSDICPSAFIAMLAILKAGGVCIPTDRQHSTSQLTCLVQMTQCRVVLVSSNLQERLGLLPQDVSMLIFDDFEIGGILSTEWRRVTSTVNSSNAAFITSKHSSSDQNVDGVIFKHEALSNGISSWVAMHNIGPGTRIGQFAAYTSTTDILEIFGALHSGACVCLLSENDQSISLGASLSHLEVTFMTLTPSVARALNPRTAPALKTLIFSGEKPTQEMCSEWQARDNRYVGHVYSLAEFFSHIPLVRHRNTSDEGNIAEPVPGARVWIVSCQNPNKLCPLGAVGELIIEGPGLASGYLRDSRDMAESEPRFLTNPPWLVSYGITSAKELALRPRRFFKTGDLARYDFDGCLVYVRRMDGETDDQLLEVQRQLERLSDLGTVACVLPVESKFVNDHTSAQNKILAAFLQYGASDKNGGSHESEILSTSTSLTSWHRSLRKQLQGCLPRHLVPSLYIPISAIPITVAGKLDSRRLHELMDGVDPLRIRSDYMVNIVNEPSAQQQEGAMETRKKLTEIWGDILEMPPQEIGPDDNFFNSGGDSVNAMKLASACRAAGYIVNSSDVFANPVMRDLGAFLEQKYEGKASGLEVPKRPAYFSLLSARSNTSLLLEEARSVLSEEVEIEDILPATEFQSLCAAGLMKRSRWQLSHFSLDGDGDVDVQTLKSAFATISAQFEILRTECIFHKGQVFQVILKHREVPITVYEVADLEEATSTVTDQLGASLLSLSYSPRVAVLRSKESSRTRIVLSLSHANYDGISLRAIWESLATAYNDGEVEPSLVQFPSYLTTVNDPKLLEEGQRHWSQSLDGSTITQIIETVERPVEQMPLPRRFSKPLILNDVASGVGALGNFTASTMITTAWALVLGVMAQRNDVVFGTLVSGRNLPIPGIDSVVGPCLNIRPTRVAWADNDRFLDILDAVHGQQTASMPFESLGCEEMWGEEGRWAGKGYFGAVLHHQNVGYLPVVHFGENEFRISDRFSVEESLADIEVFSRPKKEAGRGAVEIAVGFSERVPEEVAMEMLHALMFATEFFRRGPLRTFADLKRALTTEPNPVSVVRLPVSPVSTQVSSHTTEFLQSRMTLSPSLSTVETIPSVQGAKTVPDASHGSRQSGDMFQKLKARVLAMWAEVQATDINPHRPVQSRMAGFDQPAKHWLIESSDVRGVRLNFVELANLVYLIRTRLRSRVTVEDVLECRSVDEFVKVVAKCQG